MREDHWGTLGRMKRRIETAPGPGSRPWLSETEGRCEGDRRWAGRDAGRFWFELARSRLGGCGRTWETLWGCLTGGYARRGPGDAAEPDRASLVLVPARGEANLAT